MQALRMRGYLQERGVDLTMKLGTRKPRITLYARNPKKNYAFEKVGEVAFWESYGKAFFINGILYDLILVERESEREA
tara:strand:- start:2345 stop:2578 length:234 start_codon:yes stop_codon:yes gene_type:complete